MNLECRPRENWIKVSGQSNSKFSAGCVGQVRGGAGALLEGAMGHCAASDGGLPCPGKGCMCLIVDEGEKFVEGLLIY